MAKPSLWRAMSQRWDSCGLDDNVCGVVVVAVDVLLHVSFFFVVFALYLVHFVTAVDWDTSFLYEAVLLSVDRAPFGRALSLATSHVARYIVRGRSVWRSPAPDPEVDVCSVRSMLELRSAGVVHRPLRSLSKGT